MMKSPFINLIIGIVMAGLVFSQTGCADGKKPVSLEELDQIVDTYCQYIAQEQYQEAYDKCLTAGYRKEIALPDFIKAHIKRRENFGIVLDKKRSYDTKIVNIFTGIREFKLIYELKYPKITLHENVKLNDEDGEFRIEGTYTFSAGNSLRFMVW